MGKNLKRSNVSKYTFRRLTPPEFNQLMFEAGISKRDFLYITGRHSIDLDKYSGKITTGEPKTPMISEVILLELIRRNPDIQDDMIDIANGFSLGAQEEKETT